jgi:hypothetical protein
MYDTPPDMVDESAANFVAVHGEEGSARFAFALSKATAGPRDLRDAVADALVLVDDPEQWPDTAKGRDAQKMLRAALVAAAAVLVPTRSTFVDEDDRALHS